MNSRTLASLLSCVFLVGLGAGDGSAQVAPTVSLFGGPSLPTGTATDAHNIGFALGTSAGVELSPRLRVEAALGYQLLRRDDEAALRRTEWENGDRFEAAGGFLDGGNRSALTLLVNVKGFLAPQEALARPYVLAGGGFARTELGDLRMRVLQQSETFPGESGTGLAANAGAGVAVGVGEAASLLGQVVYTWATGEGDDLTMAGVQLGLSYRVGGSR